MKYKIGERHDLPVNALFPNIVFTKVDVEINAEGLGYDELFPVDLYGKIPCYGTCATNEEINQAVEGLADLLEDPDFAGPGRRNNDAVNLVIFLWVLGYYAVDSRDEANWLDEFETDLGSNFEPFKEHVERIQPYADSWGMVGNEGNALKYLV